MCQHAFASGDLPRDLPRTTLEELTVLSDPTAGFGEEKGLRKGGE